MARQKEVKTDNPLLYLPDKIIDMDNLLNDYNLVNGDSTYSAVTSLSTGVQGRQVNLDHHQINANIKQGMWNVHTLYQLGKLEYMKQEMNSFNLNILSLSMVSWKEAGCFQT